MSDFKYNMLRGRCPRCGSKKNQEHIKAWNEVGMDGKTYFNFDTFRCKDCGLRYDE